MPNSGRKTAGEEGRTFVHRELPLRRPSLPRARGPKFIRTWIDPVGSLVYLTGRIREGSGRCYGHPERGKRKELGTRRAVDQ